MTAQSHRRRDGRSLQTLAADVARLCHAQEAVLSCGSAIVAHWSAGPGPRFVVAAQPFGVGADAYELRLLDRRPRELTPVEVGAFQAMTEVVQHHLEAGRGAGLAPDEAWVKDHVTVAVDYVSDSFVLLLRDWTIRHVNTPFERIVNLPRADIVGRSFWDLFPQASGTVFETELRLAMDGTVPRVFEGFSEVSNRWFQSRAFPCKEGLGVLTTDITDRKQAELAGADSERRALQAQRMESLGTLAGGIAHDFNNILGAILGHVGLLKDRIPPGAPARESVDQIGIAGTRARDLVHQILTFARTTSREFVRQPLRPLVAESLQLLRSALPPSVTLETTLTDEPLNATLNPMEVQQLLMNLGTNAWHALHDGHGRIAVQLARVCQVAGRKADIGELAPGLYAELVVSDTGTGISPDTLARLFEPFFTTKRRGQGTGLGLHVVSGIVTAHGGAIVVDSQPGFGSRFALYLPAAGEARPEPPPPAPAAPPQAHGERVAYVDDDEVMLLMVQRVLEREGYAVTTFGDPRQLLDALAADAGCFDLLVTDYSMPGMNGLEVARAVRRQCPEIPIIVATGYVPGVLRKALQELGNAEILNKELTFEQLGVRAAQALRLGAAPRPGSSGS